VILAEVVRITSNDRTSTFKLHIRTTEDIANREDISAVETFKQHFENCLDDLNWHCNLLAKAEKLSKGAYIGEITLKLLDSKTKIFTPNNTVGFYDLLVTSPPYGDNKTTVTYGQHSFLPLQWIDLDDIHELATSDFLKTTSEIDTRGLGGKLKKLEDEKMELLFQNSPSFQNTITELSLVAPNKVRKVANFIHDLYLSIINVQDSLKENAYQIWTVGNRNVGGIEIPNDQIIKELIISRGSILVTRIEREILNKRMPKTNGESDLMSYEDILIFRKI
jgi:Mg2+ and Co2+ transporter CorA